MGYTHTHTHTNTHTHMGHMGYTLANPQSEPVWYCLQRAQPCGAPPVVCVYVCVCVGEGGGRGGCGEGKCIADTAHTAHTQHTHTHTHAHIHTHTHTHTHTLPTHLLRSCSLALDLPAVYAHIAILLYCVWN
jgi:hypothetical protein